MPSVTLNTLLQEVLKQSALWTHEELPFTVSLEPGHARVAVIAGENAEGKSLLAQSLVGWAQRFHKVAPISISIRERTGSGSFEMAGMRKVMIFGDEHQQSTGATSARVTGTAFRNLAMRAEDNKCALLLLDEPELGLSDGYAEALGTLLAQEALQMPALAAGVAIVTHNRPLVRALSAGLGERPTFVKCGQPAAFETWLEGEAARSVEDLLALTKTGTDRWRAVNRILDELRVQKN